MKHKFLTFLLLPSLLLIASCDTHNIDDSSSTSEENIVTLSSLYPWIDEVIASPDKVEEIRIESGAVGVTPGVLKTIHYSTNNEDVNTLINFLNETATEIPTLQGQISGGSYQQLRILFNNTYYYINVNNGNVFVDDKYYSLDTFPSLTYSDPLYAFITQGFDDVDVYVNGELVEHKDNYLANLEFRQNVDAMLYEFDDDTYMLTSFYSKLYLNFDGITFKLAHINSNGEEYVEGIYQIVGDNNFKYLFE